jgi:RNA polymerase sigma factor (sigma-70 family)
MDFEGIPATGLSLKEEFELGSRARAGDIEARNELVRSNLRFVMKVAHHYVHGPFTLEELFSAGAAGMIRAADRFDPNRGFKFISYAVHWVRQGIQDMYRGELRNPEYRWPLDYKKQLEETPFETARPFREHNSRKKSICMATHDADLEWDAHMDAEKILAEKPPSVKDRDWRIFRKWVELGTFTEVAKSEAVTRQRVEQIVAHVAGLLRNRYKGGN